MTDRTVFMYKNVPYILMTVFPLDHNQTFTKHIDSPKWYVQYAYTDELRTDCAI